MEIETIDYVEDMRLKLMNYIEEQKQKNQNKKSQVQIAKELGISTATLSLFLSKKYTGNNQDVAHYIEQYLTMGTLRKSLAKEPDLCLKLTNTEMILEKTHITHCSNDILLIYGSAGCGKTTALQYYAQNNNGVIYVEADVTVNSHRAILMLILEALGEETKGATSILMHSLIKKLKDTNQLIIIDEAQHLTPKSFDALRALNDKAHVGIIYAGNPNILKRMYGSREEEFDQVYSRIGYRCPLDNKYSFEDITHIYQGLNITLDCLRYLHRISQRKGGLRLMIKQYKLASNIAIALNENLTIECLEEAGKRMGIALGV